MVPTSPTEQEKVANMETILQTYSALEDLRAFCSSSEFDRELEQLFYLESGTKKDLLLQTLKQWEKDQRSCFHPENNHTELKTLKEKAMDASIEDKETKRTILLQICAIRESIASDIEEYEKVMNLMQRKIATVTNVGSGRSNRARKAGLLSKHAGKNVIEGAPVDKFGNPLGTEFDLGVDGAFDGMEIVVLNYHLGLERKHCLKAFEQKGFKCHWFNFSVAPKELKKYLENPNVTQFWLISNGVSHLVAEHLEIIRAYHKSGRSMYIWGDNFPLYVDGNILISHLFGKGVEMNGNVHGDEVVHLVEEDKNGDCVKKGFISHLITTGMQHLYEGITVASFNEKEIKLAGFTPLMWGSAGNLITIFKESSDEGGAVMCDGAFTRLFYKVDDAGTIRYIINAACWLAAEAFHMIQPEFELPEESEGEAVAEYIADGAFSEGICSLSWEPSPIVYVSFMQLGDPESNTGDLVLNDPLGYGENNISLLGRYLYGKSSGEMVLDMGIDPYVRMPVAGLLPAVSLEHGENRKLFNDELCRIFMGRMRLYSAAQLLFVSTLDAALDPCRVGNYDESAVSVFEFLLNESLCHFRTTPDFTDVGDKIPLIDAMKYYFTISPELLMINRSCNTVCLIARTLLTRSLVPCEDLNIIVRRSFIKHIVQCTMQYAKAEKTSCWKEIIKDLLYTMWHGIPLVNSGTLATSLPSFIRNHYKAPLDRYEAQSGATTIQTPEVMTFVLMRLLDCDPTAWKVDALLTKFCKNPTFMAMWNGKGNPSQDFVVKELNSIFSGFHTSSSHNELTPFVTTYGPSVFSCSDCGKTFGEVAQEVSEENSEIVKKARNAHFQEHFASDKNGYPTAVSVHYSLHRSVQIVMRDFPSEIALCEGMVEAVASRLVKSNKGNFFVSNIKEVVEAALESYLECRNRGEEDPPDYVKFHDRLQKERAYLYRIYLNQIV